MPKIVVYELNEVPWRVIDRYVGLYPASHLAQLLKTGSQMTTHTYDGGELHPWTTWPTLHRGVANDVHHIHSLNQDLAPSARYRPVWEALAANNVSVGVFGSLQSYPPLSAPAVKFHVPDTFAPDAASHPAALEKFQAFNLQAARDNKAVQRKLSLSSQLGNLLYVLPQLSAGSVMTLARHVQNELSDKLHKSRRATMQPVVGFDLFMRQLKKHQPDYAAFFSNHVAGMQHRYWKYLFPEDFDYTLQDKPFDRFHARSVLDAMDIFDAQLGRLMNFAAAQNYELIVVSSMGQEAIDRNAGGGEMAVKDAEKLFAGLGFAGRAKENPAMQPDFAVAFQNEADRDAFLAALETLLNAEGRPVLSLRYPPAGLTVNLKTPTLKGGGDDIFLAGHKMTAGELGLEVFKRDPGTGYHQPEGILIWQGASAPKLKNRETVDSRLYAPTLLRAYGIMPPDYMMPPLAA